jgi:hypothetical protein
MARSYSSIVMLETTGFGMISKVFVLIHIMLISVNLVIKVISCQQANYGNTVEVTQKEIFLKHVKMSTVH